MKIVLAPDSFKGNLTSLEVASAFEKGIKRVIADAECVKISMADGGEGTMRSLLDARGGKRVRKRVIGAAGQPVFAHYALLADGETAVIEIAAASGLPQVEGTPDKNPMKTTTYGAGQLIADAIARGALHLIIGLGGSATVDLGTGLAQALGIEFTDRRGKTIQAPGAGGMLHTIAGINMRGLNTKIRRTKISVATDVQNTLCGKRGTAQVFGPQKGATPAMVKKLDANLRHLASVIKRELRRDILKLKGGGAAGGLGAGMVAFLDARLENGVDVVVEATRLAQHIRGADLVMTGEGRIDAQTAFGKTPLGVARAAAKQGVPTIAIGGGIADDAGSVFACGIEGLESACARDMSLEEAIRHSKTHLANAAERALRLVLIGGKLPANR